MAFAVSTNGSVTMEADGRPFLSNRIPSSKLPELQEPQSPIPATSTSQFAANSSMMSWCAGTLALCLLRIM